MNLVKVLSLFYFFTKIHGYLVFSYAKPLLKYAEFGLFLHLCFFHKFRTRKKITLGINIFYLLLFKRIGNKS